MSKVQECINSRLPRGILGSSKPTGCCAQANAWQSFSGGSVPGAGVAYRHHVAVWSDEADGFYTFGGYGGSRETKFNINQSK